MPWLLAAVLAGWGVPVYRGSERCDVIESIDRLGMDDRDVRPNSDDDAHLTSRCSLTPEWARL